MTKQENEQQARDRIQGSDRERERIAALATQAGLHEFAALLLAQSTKDYVTCPWCPGSKGFNECAHVAAVSKLHVAESKLRVAEVAITRLSKLVASSAATKTWVKTWRVVETDNFGGDYPNERFLAKDLTKENADVFADAWNVKHGAAHDGSRFAKVVEHEVMEYRLEPGFEP